jgi:hypothetical protein
VTYLTSVTLFKARSRGIYSRAPESGVDILPRGTLEEVYLQVQIGTWNFVGVGL